MGRSAARLFRDKLAMRVQARSCGIRIPDFVRILHHDEVRQFLERVPPPWLIKPRTEASAAGIKRVQSADEVWQTIEQLGDDQSFRLLEQMIPGELYHVDSLVAGGRVVFAAVSKYHRPLLEIWQGGGIFSTRTLPVDHPDAERLRRINEQVLQGFGMDSGVSHTEFMRGRVDGEFYLIETSARVGGSRIAEMVEAAYGLNLWSEWAKVEIDRDEPYTPPPLRN